MAHGLKICLHPLFYLGALSFFGLVSLPFFFLTVVSTAHFRLGRYAELTSEFGSAVLIMLIAFAVSIMLRVVRVVMGARRDAVYSRANSFWTDPPLGVFYSVISILHLILTAIFYVKGIAALRALAGSQFHTHPDAMPQRQIFDGCRSATQHSLPV